MAPAFSKDEVVQSVTMSGVPNLHDVVVIQNPRDPGNIALRVAALEGDVVSEIDGEIAINAVKLVPKRDGRGKGDQTDTARIQLPINVPPQHVFLLADNSETGYDSRYFGPVAIAKIVSRVRDSRVACR
jgi:signal peptidase I